MNATGYFDGGVRATRGHHACAAVLRFPSGETTCDVQYLGPHGTSNQAEVMGLILVLELAQRAGVTNLEIFGDSKLTVEQAIGSWKIKNAELGERHAVAQKLARGFESVKIAHVKREYNKDADALCTAMLDNITGVARGS